MNSLQRFLEWYWGLPPTEAGQVAQWRVTAHTPWSESWPTVLIVVVIAAAVLIFVPVAGDYVTPSLVGGPEGQMIGTLIQVQFLRVGDWPFGAALSFGAAILGAFMGKKLASATNVSKAAAKSPAAA